MASVSKRRWKHNGVEREAWAVRYFDQEGRRRSKTFELKKLADAFARKVERDLQDGTHVADEHALSVGDVCERFIAASDARRRRGEIGSTRMKQLRIYVDSHIVPTIGTIRFRDVTAPDVDRLFDAMTEKISPFYARMIVSNLATIERWAVRQGFLRTTPVATALKGIKPVPAPMIEEFTSEQVAMLLGHVLRRAPDRKRYAALLACAVHLAACCGLRSGEIRALDLESIDLERKRLRIRRNLTDMMELKGPKSKAGNRDVPIPDHLCEMLRRWIDRYIVPHPDGYVFTTFAGKPLGPQGIRKGWRVVLNETGLFRDGQVFHFHALRHFAGSWWLEHGMAIQDVSLQLGHANAATTLSIYAHTVTKPADRQASMTQMGRVLLGPPAAPMTQMPV